MKKKKKIEREKKERERLGSKIIRQCTLVIAAIASGSSAACQKITADRLLVHESFLRAGAVGR